ncbi:MAG: S8 family serine peptidase [Actinobacteria bacterium]|nr:S8 family serine peptidase [Actinomycetota bacterium]
MRASKSTALATVIALLPILAATNGDVSAEAAGEANFVVLATDAASTDAAIASIEAAGGQVTAANYDVGLVSVSAPASEFSASLAGAASVAGVARDVSIGTAPVDAVSPTKAVEEEAQLAGRSAPNTRTYAPQGNGGTTVVPEPLAPLQWDMAMIGATADGSYRKQPGRRDVLVGVIDTGIDASHPDIAPNFNPWLSRNFTTDIESIDGPCAEEPDQSCSDPSDVDEGGHGTHVASTIASPINGLGIAGVAPNVTLVNLRAGQDSGYFFLQPTVDALTFAANHGIDVVNMSFYIDPWLFNCAANPADTPEQQAEQRLIISATQRALDYARRRGVTLVAALGNDHTDLGNPTIDETSPDFPVDTAYTRTIDNSCLDMPTEGRGVISVSSVGPSGAKSDFSNHGLEQNDVSAPGGWFRDFFGTPQFRTNENLVLGAMPKQLAIESGLVDLTTGQSLDGTIVAQCTGATIDTCAYYEYLQGTSMASPHAAGVAALIISKYGHRDWWGGRTMNPALVEKILKRTATDVACPAPVITYVNEGRDASFDAPCVGTARRNSIYGDGIVNALRAVS